MIWFAWCAAIWTPKGASLPPDGSGCLFSECTATMTSETLTPTRSRRLALVRARLASDGVVAALGELRTHLQREDLSPEEYDAAGQLLRRIVREHPDLGLERWRFRLVGQCTTSWLANAVAALAWRDGVLLDVSEAGFDVVMQDAIGLARADPQLQPHFVCLVPWLRNVDFTDTRRAPPRLVGRSFVLERRLGTPRSDACSNHPGWLRHGSCRACRLSSEWGRGATASVRAIERISCAGRCPRRPTSSTCRKWPARWDANRSTTRDALFGRNNPSAKPAARSLAEHVVAGIRALLGGRRKCSCSIWITRSGAAWWAKPARSTSPWGKRRKENRSGNFQAYVKGLAARGVLLAVASKNNPADARGPFELNPGMVLRLHDIAAFEANWSPKAESLERIAQTLNLGLDSFVFFDDNPAEREHIRQALPQVAVVPCRPSRPTTFEPWKPVCGSRPCGSRPKTRTASQQYQAEPQRQSLRDKSTSLEDYLVSLEMVAQFGQVLGADLPRVVQLLGKTNQFNLTTRRHSAEDVRRLLAIRVRSALRSAWPTVLAITDSIAVVLAAPQSEGERDTLVIDTWLMSCRVIGRSVEQFIAGELVRRGARPELPAIAGHLCADQQEWPRRGAVSELGFCAAAAAADSASGITCSTSTKQVVFSTQIRPADAG